MHRTNHPKPRPCEVCGKEFQRRRMGQKVCGVACARKLVREEKSKAKQDWKTRWESVKSLSDLRAEAQAALNRWVVHCRDKDAPCISCGRYHEGRWHGGHYRSRGAAPHLALDERNVHKQCAPCNTHLSGNLIEYRKGLIEKIGLEAVEALEADQEPRKLTADKLRLIKAEYKLRLKECKRDE